MVVAVIAVRVVKMAGDPIIHMVAVRHRIVAAPGPVDMARIVPISIRFGLHDIRFHPDHCGIHPAY